MSATVMLVIVLYMGAGAALTLVIAQFWPTHTRLADAIAHATPITTPRRDHTPPAPPVTLTDRIGTWAHTHLTRIPGVTTPDTDLRLIGRTPRDFWGEKLILATLGLLFPPLVTALTALAGASLPFVVPAGISLFTAVLGWLLPDAQVASKAAAARAEFAAAAVSYLRLVAVKRLGGRGIVESLNSAARLSDAWMFVRIRTELALADMAGITPWEGLDRVADEVGVPELHEIADIARMSSAGAGVAEPMFARASSLRDRLLSREHSAAAKTNDLLVLPTAALLYLFVLALLYPIVLTILG